MLGNHCHVVLRPFESIKLERELGMIKQITAYAIGQRENIAGDFWQQESYDRIVRDSEHLYRVVQYIGSNPHRAGMPRDQWRRWINPTWQAVGWNFDEP